MRFLCPNLIAGLNIRGFRAHLHTVDWVLIGNHFAKLKPCGVFAHFQTMNTRINKYVFHFDAKDLRCCCSFPDDEFAFP